MTQSTDPNSQPDSSNAPQSSSQGTNPGTPPKTGLHRDIVVLAVVILVVGIMISSAVIMSRHNEAANVGNRQSAVLGDVHGAVAPDFDLKSLDTGRNVKLSDFRGKAVVLNFWATYCEPCKIEMPWFEDLSKEYASQNVQFIGVAMDDVGEDKIKDFAKQLGVTYPILLGKESVGDAYGGLQFLPMTFYIDPNGKVVERSLGIAGKGDVEANIKRALQGAPATQASAGAAKSNP